MALELRDVVSVQSSIQQGTIAPGRFGQSLFLRQIVQGPTNSVEALRDTQARSYGSLRALGRDYASSSEVYKAASRYFGQDPYPKPLVVAPYAALRIGYLYGAPVELATVAGTSANTDLEIDGHTISIDVAGDTDLADSATELQTKIRTINVPPYDTVIVAFSQDRFVITIPGVVPFNITPSAFTAALGLTGGGVVSAPGATYNTPADALDYYVTESPIDFYWIIPVIDIGTYNETEILSIADWAQANRRFLLHEETDVGVLTANEEASIASKLYAKSQNRVASVVNLNRENNSIVTDYKNAALAAHFSAVNFAAVRSLISGKFLTLSGCIADDIDSTQKSELDRKRVNHYSYYGRFPFSAEGRSFGTWIDVQYWLDWFENEIQVAVINQLRRHVPLTNQGITILHSVVQNVCEEGVLNGGVAPGQLSPALTADLQAATGDSDFDGFLPNGYFIHIGSISEQLQSQREERRLPPIVIWLKGSGAVHFAEISVVFEN